MPPSPLRTLASRLFAAAALLLPLVAAQTACNGHEEFCSRSYSNVSIIGAHNSYGVRAGSIAANQNYTVETQLDDGIRLLQVQGHMNGDELHLCHTLCLLLDGGTFTSYLSTVKSWLDSNPNEVVTILMVNSEGISPTVWAQSYKDSGLDSYAYTPSSTPVAYSAWPTYQELIDAGTRVVSFLAQNADTSSVPYLLDEFTNVWETPYGQTDNSFPCTVDRVTGSSDNKMYLVNHYLDVNQTILGTTVPVPATSSLEETNAVNGTGSLGAQAETCLAQHGYYPTFTLVDYYDVGNGSVFEYAAKLNGVAYTPVEIGNGSSSSSASSGSSSGNDSSASTDSGAAGLSAQAGLAAVGALGALFAAWAS
ncbi:PLC-like phosphodiesterase [Rhodotorula diobovata]|uniref:PLC-like phosphodiesterase n=1 Tax=Rhodotorula diobovata TaxID=5288 RepID=A0A5C5FWS1_9BASI|nr:PLC-like phosphodiesterase [Rhodotorula diobovata]